MKTRTLTLAMRNVVALLFVTIISSTTFSQTSYTGGEGGGYSSTGITISTSTQTDDGLFSKTFDFSIYPNPLQRGQILKAKVQGFDPGEKIIITISDMIGSRVHIEEIDPGDEITVNLPFEKLKKGIYLITFQHKHYKLTRRFSFSG